MTTLKLSPRLAAVASFVRKGAYLADIGTDHAYLPAWLLLHGKISRAIASDALKGPLCHAEATLEEYGLRDGIRLHLGDGLAGLDRDGVTDIAIAGMGGELIARIISEASWTKNQELRLILQPMTRQDELRRWLCRNGYAITDEALAEEDRRIYQILCVSYDGVMRQLDPLAQLAGECNIRRGGTLLLRQLTLLQKVYSVRREGKKRAGYETAEEDAVLDAILQALVMAKQTLPKGDDTDEHA